MICPACGLAVQAERVAPGESLGAPGPCVLAACCPYPACATRLFAWLDARDDEPSALLDEAELRGVQLRWEASVREPYFVAAVTLGGLLTASVAAAAHALWSLHGMLARTFVLAGALLIALPAVMCASVVWIEHRETQRQYLRRRGSWSRLRRPDLKLVPEPQGYR